jgi:Rrf2 family protein
MKLGDGVEQAIHCVAFLSGLEPGERLSTSALAEFHGVSPTYLLKHLQSLSSAGILEGQLGPAGGYRLAKPAREISLLNIVLAVEGPEPAFRCAEIRQRGPDPLPPPKSPCGINVAMLRAEKAYREELARVSVAELGAGLNRATTARNEKFIQLNVRRKKP